VVLRSRRTRDACNWSEISENYLIAAAAWLVADLPSSVESNRV